MNKTLVTTWTVRDICKGFTFSKAEGKGLFGWNGKLTIQPEYQRNYIYADGKRDAAVIDSTRELLAIDTIDRCPLISAIV